MPDNILRLVFIGDVIGRYGRRMVRNVVPLVRQKLRPDFVVANGENSAGGLGVIRRTADELFAASVDVLTGGNHVWDKKEAADLLRTEMRVLRPINYPERAPGQGNFLFTNREGRQIQIVSLQGRVFMDPVVDNPFTVMERFLAQNTCPVVFVDFHAEATAEKQAMGFFLDGRVSAVLGTHTHVPTADARILSGGTAFQSDVGMTGSCDSVIGMRKEPIIEKFLSGVNTRYEVESDSIILDMTAVDIDAQSGRALAIDTIRLHEDTYTAELESWSFNGK